MDALAPNATFVRCTDARKVMIPLLAFLAKAVGRAHDQVRGRMTGAPSVASAVTPCGHGGNGALGVLCTSPVKPTQRQAV